MMGSLQRMLLWLLSTGSMGGITLLVVQNWPTNVALQVGQATWSVSLGLAMLMTFLLGSLATFARLWDVNRRLQATMKQFELRREKAEVHAETSSDQIRTMEAKIQTLEKALEQALSSPSSTKKG